MDVQLGETVQFVISEGGAEIDCATQTIQYPITIPATVTSIGVGGLVDLELHVEGGSVSVLGASTDSVIQDDVATEHVAGEAAAASAAEEAIA